MILPQLAGIVVVKGQCKKDVSFHCHKTMSATEDEEIQVRKYVRRSREGGKGSIRDRCKVDGTVEIG